MKVKLINQAENLLARVIELNIQGFSIKTPKKALWSYGSRYCEAAILSAPSYRGIIEIYLRLNSDQLNKLLDDEKKRNSFKYRLVSALKKVRENEIVVLIPEYEATESHFKKSMEYMADLLLHPRVNILAVPIIRNMTLDNVIENIRTFVNSASGAFDILTVPTILPIPLLKLEALIREYEVFFSKYNSFRLDYVCLDFNSSNPISKYDIVRFTLRKFKQIENEIRTPVVIHGVNVKYGRAVHKEKIAPARDLTSPYMGIDILGSNHKPLKLPREYMVKKEFKVLNIKEYGYYDLNQIIPGNLSYYEPKNSLITINTLHKLEKAGNHLTLEAMIKNYNAEKQELELQNILTQLQKNENLEERLNSKSSLDEKSKKIVKKHMRKFYEQNISFEKQ